MTSQTETGSAQAQGRLWGVRADDWAAIQENKLAPAFIAALDALRVSAGTRLLDVGCGAGMVLRLAADRGADVTGIDASEALLTHARRRVPGAPIVQGEIEDLPFDDDSFDVVTGFNSFQYAAHPVAALAESVRVVAPGGRVLLLTWGMPEQCDAAAYLAALGALMPPPPPGAEGPFALSAETALSELFGQVGLAVETIADIACEWSYSDEATALAGLMCSGPVVGVIEHAGEEAVRAAAKAFLDPFRTDDGGYLMTNTFRYALSAPVNPGG
jgi:SAM-dependent methyltransferase